MLVLVMLAQDIQEMTQSLPQTSPFGVEPMKDPTIVAAAVVTVIAALAAALISVINAVVSGMDRRAAMIERRAVRSIVTTNNEKADQIIQKTTEIGVSTNGALAKEQAKSKAAEAQIEAAAAQIAAYQQIVDRLTTAMEKKDAFTADLATRALSAAAPTTQPTIAASGDPVKVTVVDPATNAPVTVLHVEKDATPRS